MASKTKTQARDIIRGEQLEENIVLSADVVIIGTGAGGGVTAEILAKAGYKVIMLEEGDYKTAKDFKMQENDAYRQLYHDAGGRKTKDNAITILQGKTVGGTTTVNWTTCFRTPPETLNHWTQVHKLRGFNEHEMAPWFAMMEKRLNINPWGVRNANNDTLYRGAQSLGWHAEMIHRNVLHCHNLGYCGMGCPVDAKQSMLVTTVPAALDNGATLISRVRAEKLEFQGDQVTAIHGLALDSYGVVPTGVSVRIEAPYIVAAGGGINNPALLLRSKIPDPHGRIGKRTFLHLTVGGAGLMPEKVNPFYGAPQSAYSNEFLWRDGVSGKVGYKLEAAPLHPALASTMFTAHGEPHYRFFSQLPYINANIALLRDGFHEDSQGAEVSINKLGEAVIDYPMTDYLWEGIQHAYLSMAESQFAAGAKAIMPIHTDARPYASWQEAKTAIASLPMRTHRALLFSAHVMGGCAMGEDPKTSVVNSLGKHHQLANLYIIDGSTFPTSIGANPSLSIYGVAARQASVLAELMGGAKKQRLVG